MGPSPGLPGPTQLSPACLFSAPASGARSPDMNQSCLSWAPASLGVFFCIPACEPQASLGTATRGSGAPPATRTLQTGPFTLQAVPLQPPGATMGPYTMRVQRSGSALGPGGGHRGPVGDCGWAQESLLQAVGSDLAQHVQTQARPGHPCPCLGWSGMQEGGPTHKPLRHGSARGGPGLALLAG